jgi:hypothetical protein
MGFTGAEASEVMGNEEATVRSQLRTGRRRFATLLRLRCSEHPDGKNRHDADYWLTELLRRQFEPALLYGDRSTDPCSMHRSGGASPPVSATTSPSTASSSSTPTVASPAPQA